MLLRIMWVHVTKYALLEIFNTHSLKISYKDLYEEKTNFNTVWFSPMLKVNSYNYFRNTIKNCSQSGYLMSGNESVVLDHALYLCLHYLTFYCTPLYCRTAVHGRTKRLLLGHLETFSCPKY